MLTLSSVLMHLNVHAIHIIIISQLKISVKELIETLQQKLLIPWDTSATAHRKQKVHGKLHRISHRQGMF